MLQSTYIRWKIWLNLSELEASFYDVIIVGGGVVGGEGGVGGRGRRAIHPVWNLSTI